jgi:hypothetical protein
MRSQHQVMWSEVVGADCLGGRWASRSASWVAAVGTRPGRSVVRERSRLRSGQSCSLSSMPLVCTSIEFGVVVDHKHDLPLEHVAVD